MRLPDPNHSESEAKTLADIAEFGVHIVHVLKEDEAAAFSYTVGLTHSFQHPEVMVFGLPEEVAHALLNVVADEISDGAKFAGGTRHEGLLEGYPVRFVDVRSSDYDDYVGRAQWVYDIEAFAVVQLVYPDQQGRWPWLDGVRDVFRKCQPVLGEPPA